jgi:hypothetical protein
MTTTRRKFADAGMEIANGAGWLTQIIHRLR